MKQSFNYTGERFADIQMLRYRLTGFSMLTLKQKLYIYYLSEAALWGRDITFDQFGKNNLKIRQLLEQLYTEDRENKEVEELLKRVWFSSGIHHHYAQNKFECKVENAELQQLFAEEQEMRVCLKDGVDLVESSACNYYQGVTQKEVEAFYAEERQENAKKLHALNSNLVRTDYGPIEEVWCLNGKYGAYIEKIIYWLEKAKTVCENQQQAKVIELLVEYYRTGDLDIFDQYSIEWIKEKDGRIDFINGFIEVYGDPLGLKGSWEAIVEYKDLEATERTRKICENAQWFEDHSPVDSRFKKKQVTGVTASVINAAMLGGDEYPASAIGINLPNADWIRAQYGSKSVTIGNLTEAYNEAAKNSGMRNEFVPDETVRELLDKYDDACDDLHTDLHECLGHGSGLLLEGVDANALKSYGSTIEEARADLFGLYYMADNKLVELGLLPDGEAYKAQYYSYMLNGLMTQLVRIEEGAEIEESHMRNRAIIARWAMAHSDGSVRLEKQNGKTVLTVEDYEQLRQLFAQLLAEVQRIKSEGDYDAAREMVEHYGIKIDAEMHKEVLERYKKLNIAPYKGFINPVLKPVIENGEIVDVEVDYTESYTDQMLRYSKDYSL